MLPTTSFVYSSAPLPFDCQNEGFSLVQRKMGHLRGGYTIFLKFGQNKLFSGVSCCKRMIISVGSSAYIILMMFLSNNESIVLIFGYPILSVVI